MLETLASLQSVEVQAIYNISHQIYISSLQLREMLAVGRLESCPSCACSAVAHRLASVRPMK
eukprot:5434534-Amphidinium_carterae.1